MSNELEGRFARSWRLTKTAWSVVRGDPTLLVLALLAGVVTGAVTAAYLVCAGTFHPAEHGRAHLLGWLAIFAWPLSFVATFMSTATAAAGAAALGDGPRLTAGQALAVPVRRIGAVLGWSLLAAGVGLLLQEVAARVPFGGRIVAALGGVAWALLTLFAIPILVLEGTGPLRAARRSGQLVRERWGEALGGTVSIAVWAAIPYGAAAVLVVVGVLAGSTAGAVLIGIGAAVFALTSGLTAVTRELFSVALYRYAMDPAGAEGGIFPVADLADPPARKARTARRWRRGSDDT